MGLGSPNQPLPLGVRRQAPPMSARRSWWELTTDAYMLDTAAGQAVMLKATADVHGVAFFPDNREVEHDYSPYYNDDLTGFPLDIFVNSTSRAETNVIKQMYENNADLRENLDGHGFIRFTAGLLDPVNIVPIPFARGLGFWKGAGAAAFKGAPILGTTEAVRHAIDPTSTMEETVMNTIAGSLFMGLIGGAVGKIPVDSMTVTQALNKLTGRPGVTGMGFGPIPGMGTPKGVLNRLFNSFKNGGGSGNHTSTTLKKGDLIVTREKGSDVVEIRHKATGHVVLEGQVKDGVFQIKKVSVPGKKRRGIGAAAYKEAVQFAEDNGLSLVSDSTVSPATAKRFAGLEEEGLIVVKNETAELQADGSLKSKDGKPVYELKAQIDADKKQIPQDVRDELKGLEEEATMASVTLRALQMDIAKARRKWKKAQKSGGAKTKARKEYDALIKQHPEIDMNARLTKLRAQERNIAVVQMLDEATIRDWDLLPTGYNKLLGKLDQMPWWRLLKTPLRKLKPEIAVELQKFALKIGATPGLNNLGNKLEATTGSSVEARVYEYTGRWMSAIHAKNRIYRKMTGHGSSSGQVRQFMIDSGQRTKNMIERRLGQDETTVTSDGFYTIREFDKQISIAIASGGKHKVPEVAEAAGNYAAVLKEMGEEGIEMGIFATQKTIIGNISKVQAKIDALKEIEEPKQGTLRELDDLELQKMELDQQLERYATKGNNDYLHRIWLHEEVEANEDVIKQMLHQSFEDNPIRNGKIHIREPDIEYEPGLFRPGKIIKSVDYSHPDAMDARVNEAFASILHDAETGGDASFMPKGRDKLDWLNARKDALEFGDTGKSKAVAELQVAIIERKMARIRDGEMTTGAGGPLIAQKLILDDAELIRLGFIEGNVDTWMNHYVSRTAPIIETARKFGDGRATAEIERIIKLMEDEATAVGPGKVRDAIEAEIEPMRVAMEDLVDIVHGTYSIPKDPSALTGRTLRLLRNFNVLGAMGRSVFMAFGDIGNVVISQGLRRTLGFAAESYASALSDGKIKMMKDEVDLAGSASEVVLGMRWHQLTEMGATTGQFAGKFGKLERGVAAASQRFFVLNMLGPWTDMARRFSGAMLQSQLIKNSIMWGKGTLSLEDITIMGRLGISKGQAAQFVELWEAAGKLMHKNMYIANTSNWGLAKEAKSVFRAAMNTEINRMVPTPGAVDKPKALLKSEWWKIFGQYRGFSIAATHRIYGAGVHTPGAVNKFNGMVSMVGIAMMVDAIKRPDYIKMPLDEQLLRAVELSGVTGVMLDFNDMLERITAGTDMEAGLRPMFDMDIRERNPNWATRMGVMGAVPNSWLTLMYGLTSDEATTNDQARAIRYLIPYNNLLWWNEYFNRMQRSATDFVDDRGE